MEKRTRGDNKRYRKSESGEGANLWAIEGRQENMNEHRISLTAVPLARPFWLAHVRHFVDNF